MIALNTSNYSAARALLLCGVDAWRGDVRGNTALHQAAWRVRVGEFACALAWLA
jgi:hypothetical protein